MLKPMLLLTVVIIVAKKTAGKLNYVNREVGWNEEVRFWGQITCRAGRRRIFALHEIRGTDSSRRLHDFFENLVTNAQSKCRATMITKSYRTLNYTYNPTYFSLLGGEEGNEISKNPSMVIEKSDNVNTSSESDINLFPQRDVEILVVLIDDCVKILMNGNIFKNWDIRRHALVLMITKKRMTTDKSKLLVNTFVILLQRLWEEHRILNVFFAAPFSTYGHLIWFYDPFVKNVTSGVRGKIFGLRVWNIPRIGRVMNLQGYRLKVGMFEAQPAAIKYGPKSNNNFPFAKGTHGFVGMDGLTMTAIAKHMNFKYDIVPPSDGVEFGYVHCNGTFVGTIGDAAYHRIDIGFNSMYIKIYTPGKTETNIIEFTVPINFDRLCVVVPRAQKVPRWLRTFYYFHPAIWACIVIALFLVALAWYILRKIQNLSTRRTPSRESYWSLLVATFFLYIGAPINYRATRIERIILAALLLSGVTMMGTFTGTLYYNFTNEMYYKEISSLRELDELGIPVATASPNLHDVFGLEKMADDPPEVQSLRRKLKIMEHDGVPTIEKTAYRRNVAALAGEHSFAVTEHHYVDETGDSLLHLVHDCPRSYYLAYIVPKDSVYIDRFNTLIRRLLEAGLPSLWNSVTTNKLITVQSTEANMSRLIKDERAPFNVRDMQTSFLLLGIGHAVAIVVLIGEVIIGKKQRSTKIGVRFHDEIMKSSRNLDACINPNMNVHENQMRLKGRCIR